MKTQNIKVHKPQLHISSVPSEIIQNLSVNGIRLKPSVIRILLAKAMFPFIFIIMSSTLFAQQELMECKAAFNGSKVKLYWSIAQDDGINYFSVERSWNGKEYETIGLVLPEHSKSRFRNYSFIDKDYFSSLIYYRIKTVNVKGETRIVGNIIALQLAADAKEFAITPMQGVPGFLYADASRIEGDEVILDAVDAEGQIIANAILNKNAGKVCAELKSLRQLSHSEYVISAFFNNKVIKTRLKVIPVPGELSGRAISPLQVFSLK